MSKKKKVRLDMLVSELRKEKLIAYSILSGMTMTQAVEFFIDTLKIPRNHDADSDYTI